MKIKRFDFWIWIMYPNVLNLFCWIAVGLFILNVIFLSWWKEERSGRYNVYKINKKWYKSDYAKYVFLGPAAMFINTFWWNRKLTLSYVAYLEAIWFPYYEKDNWQRWENQRQKYHWYLNNRLIFFKNIKKQIYLLRFDKDPDGKWFVNLPEYPGPREDLQMVAGADLLLDTFSNGFSKVYLKVSNKRFWGDSLLVKNPWQSESGQIYDVKRIKVGTFMHVPDGLDQIWLCDVLKYVFKGKFPKKIHFEIFR